MDHNEVYHSLPINIESLLKRVEFDKTLIYNRQCEGKIVTGNVAEAIILERNKKWSEEKCQQYKLSCEKLLQIMNQNKEKIPNEMLQIIYKELFDAIKQVENMEGELEL